MSYAVDCPRDCRYRSLPSSQNSSSVTCDFILIEGHSRGCDPKPYCECYRKREKVKPERNTSEGPKTRKRRAAWDYEKGFQLYQERKTTKQIAEELGISEGAVSGRRERYWRNGRA